MRNGSGYYRYKSVSDFLNGATPEIVCLTYGYDGEQKPAAEVRFHKLGIYAQDEWNSTDRFKLTLGARVDGLFFDDGDLMTNEAIKALVEVLLSDDIVTFINDTYDGAVVPFK